MTPTGKRRVAIAAGIALGLGVVCAIALVVVVAVVVPRSVRTALANAGDRYGLVLECGDVGVGWWSVVIGDVHARSRVGEALDVRIKETTVHVDLHGPTAVAADGANVRLHVSIDELRTILATVPVTAVLGSVPVPIALRGSLDWVGVVGSGSTLHADALAIDIGSQGQPTITATTKQTSLDSALVTLTGFEATVGVTNDLAIRMKSGADSDGSWQLDLAHDSDVDRATFTAHALGLAHILAHVEGVDWKKAHLDGTANATFDATGLRGQVALRAHDVATPPVKVAGLSLSLDGDASLSMRAVPKSRGKSAATIEDGKLTLKVLGAERIIALTGDVSIDASSPSALHAHVDAKGTPITCKEVAKLGGAGASAGFVSGTVSFGATVDVDTADATPIRVHPSVKTACVVDAGAALDVAGSLLEGVLRP